MIAIVNQNTKKKTYNTIYDVAENLDTWFNTGNHGGWVTLIAISCVWLQIRNKYN